MVEPRLLWAALCHSSLSLSLILENLYKHSRSSNTLRIIAFAVMLSDVLYDVLHIIRRGTEKDWEAAHCRSKSTKTPLYGLGQSVDKHDWLQSGVPENQSQRAKAARLTASLLEWLCLTAGINDVRRTNQALLLIRFYCTGERAMHRNQKIN